MRKKIPEQKMEEFRKYRKLFKVNLPDTFDNYKSGNGEGIWAIAADVKGEQLWQDDEEGAQIFVYACNDSVYYPGEIVYGSQVLVELRGENRPVAVWDDLHGTKDAMENKEKVMNQILRDRQSHRRNG